MKIYFQGNLDTILKSGDKEKLLSACGSKTGVKCTDVKQSIDDREFEIQFLAKSRALEAEISRLLSTFLFVVVHQKFWLVRIFLEERKFCVKVQLCCAIGEF